MDPHTFSVMQEWCASDAEEAQRKLKRQNGEDPALPPFCPLFASLGNILQCDVLLGMLGAVLQWAMEPSGGHWSESMLQRMFSIKTMRECTAAAPPCEGTGHCHKETVCDKDKAERKKKAELCWKKTMAQTLESQSHFINKYIDLLTQDSEDLDASASTSAEHSPSSCDSALVCVGPRRWRARGGERRQMEMCILCHEAQEILPDGTAMVLAAFVQRSTVMSKIRKRPPHNPESYDPLFMHPDLSFGTHTGSCGHIMHSHCWQRYFEAVQAKEQRRQQRLRVHTSYDVENGEYLCPLCECLSNTVIPLLPLTKTTCSGEQPGLAHWLNTTCQQIRALHSAHKRAKPTNASETETVEDYPPPEGFRLDHTPVNPYSSSIREMLTTFGTATYKVGLKVHPNEQDPRVPIMCWGSCSYTTQSIERLLVDEEKPCLEVYPVDRYDNPTYCHISAQPGLGFQRSNTHF